MHFLDLPYDIRFSIYEQLFPSVPQLYLHAVEDGVRYLPQQDSSIPIGFLLANKALSLEASEYLYNNYLINIVGRKHDCFSFYPGVLRTVKRYARTQTHVRAFSNGLGSSTGAISIAVGDAKLQMLENRQRGDPKTMEQFKQEAEIMRDVSKGLREMYRELNINQASFWWSVVCLTIGLGLLLAWTAGRLLTWTGMLTTYA